MAATHDPGAHLGVSDPAEAAHYDQVPPALSESSYVTRSHAVTTATSASVVDGPTPMSETLVASLMRRAISEPTPYNTKVRI